MKRLSLIAVCLALSLTTLAIGGKTGKLVGHVDIGPITPVERPGVKPKVTPEMYSRYRVIVTRGSQPGHAKSFFIQVLARLKLSSTGDFSVDLPPAEYVVGVTANPHSVQLPSDKKVVITAGKTTKVELHVDTGIR